MPHVHEIGGFKVYIYLPPSEHGPAPMWFAPFA